VLRQLVPILEGITIGLTMYLRLSEDALLHRSTYSEGNVDVANCAKHSHRHIAIYWNETEQEKELSANFMSCYFVSYLPYFSYLLQYNKNAFDGHT
jgi:hypothetical protein